MYVVSEALRLKLLNHVHQKVCLPNVFVRSVQMFPFVLFGFVLRNCCLLELVLFYLEFACRICSHHLNALKDTSEIKEDAIPAEAVPEVHVVPLRVESLLSCTAASCSNFERACSPIDQHHCEQDTWAADTVGLELDL